MSSRWAVGCVLATSLASCSGMAAPKNGAFVELDYCDQMVLSAIADHDELRWSQHHSQLGGGGALDVAQGFSRGESQIPVRQWSRHREARNFAGSENSAGGSSDDVLVSYYWEPSGHNRARVMRADSVTNDCRR